MKYFDMIDNNIVYCEIKDPIYHVIANKEKFGGDFKKLQIIDEFEDAFLTRIENDEKIIYWNYKAVSIDFMNPITKMKDIYQPSYYVIFQEKENEGKIVIFDVEEFEYFDTPLLSEEELNLLDDDEFVNYQNIVDKAAITVKKYLAAKKYCDKFGMHFYVITREGVRAISNEDNIRYN